MSNDIDGVKTVLEEQKPIEFTAKALGLACRFWGSDMVKALIEGGATFKFDFTPALKRKYDCKVSISNNNDMPVNFAWFLFPKYEVKGFKNAIISDDERVKVLDILFQNNMCNFSELLYWAILYNDTAIYDELKKLGTTEISDYRTDMIAGRVPKNRLDVFANHDRCEFRQLLHDEDDETFLICWSISWNV